MNQYKIALHGCDDSTYINMYMSDEQLEFTMMLCKESWQESSYGCMPIMEIVGVYERMEESK